MGDWKDTKGLGPTGFKFNKLTKNIWGYLNNPRWRNPARAFVKGGPDDYDVVDSVEPQIWKMPGERQSSDGEATHHQCGHWHMQATPAVGISCILVDAEINLETLEITGTGTGSAGSDQWRVINVDTEEVMDSGITNEAVFQFFGNITTDYQLQFRAIGAEWPIDILCIFNLSSPFPPITISLDMVSTWLFGDYAVDQKFLCTGVAIDPVDYQGIIELRFEVVAANDVGILDQPETIQLITQDDAVVSTITWNAGDPDRKEVVFTLAPGINTYYLKMLTTGDPNLSLREARIWIDFVNATKIRPQIPLISGDESTGGFQGDVTANDYFAYAWTTRHPAYGYAGLGATGPGTSRRWFRQFLYNSGNWVTPDHWTFLVVGGHDKDYEGTGYFALFNKTKDLMVAGTELAFTEIAPTPKSVDFAVDAANFDDGDEFEVRAKWGGDENAIVGAICYRAELYVSLIAPVFRLESHMRVGGPIVGSFPVGLGGGYENSSRLKFPGIRLDAKTAYFFECTAKGEGGDAKLFLSDVGIFDTGLMAYTKYAGNVVNSSGPTWTSPELAEGPEDFGGSITSSSATISIAASGDPEGIILANDFNFDSVLPDRAVTGVFVELFVAIYNSGLPYGDLAGRFKVQSSVDGTAIGSFLNAVCPESQLGVNIEIKSLFFTLTSQRSWVKEDFALDLFQLYLGNYTNWTGGNAGRSFAVNAVKVTVEMGENVTQSLLEFSTTEFERKRTENLYGILVNENRYIVHYADISSGQTLGEHSSPFLIAVIGEPSGLLTMHIELLGNLVT